MYDSVSSIFPSWSKRFEGRVHFMYLDIKGLVTTGVGNLIDPIQYAMGLPWVHIGAPDLVATPSEIASEWNKMKSDQTLAHRGYQACGRIAKLMLTDDGIDELIRRKLATNETFLQKTFLDWNSWPADAQLAVLSMAWAMGAGFTHTFVGFTASAQKGDWAMCANECHINTKGNPGVIPRNAADIKLFLAAAETVASSRDVTLLHGADA